MRGGCWWSAPPILASTAEGLPGVLDTLGSRVRPPRKIASPLDPTGGHANDDLPLHKGGQDQHGQSDNERRRGKRSPRQLFEGQDVEDRDRQGPRLAAGQDDGEDEVVPGEDKREDGGNDHTG